MHKTKKKKKSMITEELTIDASSPLAKDETEGAGWGWRGGLANIWDAIQGKM